MLDWDKKCYMKFAEDHPKRKIQQLEKMETNIKMKVNVR
jgi:hypothetical protein